MSKILETIKSIENGTNKEIKSFQELYDTGDKNNQWIAEYGQSTKNQIRSTEGVINANKKARESAIAHNNTLKQQTLGAKAATVATKALSVALNMVAMWAITEAISAVVTGLHDLATESETAKENADSFATSVNSLNENIANDSSKLSDLNSKYQELSKGVNNLGENISLSSSEYDDMLNFTKQWKVSVSKCYYFWA